MTGIKDVVRRKEARNECGKEGRMERKKEHIRKMTNCNGNKE